LKGPGIGWISRVRPYEGYQLNRSMSKNQLIHVKVKEVDSRYKAELAELNDRLVRMKHKSYETKCNNRIWGKQRQLDAERAERRVCLASANWRKGAFQRLVKRHIGPKDEFLRRCLGLKRHNSIGDFESVFRRLMASSLGERLAETEVAIGDQLPQAVIVSNYFRHKPERLAGVRSEGCQPEGRLSEEEHFETHVWSGLFDSSWIGGYWLPEKVCGAGSSWDADNARADGGGCNGAGTPV
jgi:hypothetical protein